MTQHADVFVVGRDRQDSPAAYCLTKDNPSVVVIEKNPTYVDNISRTVCHKDFMFDIGGHRFSRSTTTPTATTSR